jgi:hypothetical protein
MTAAYFTGRERQFQALADLINPRLDITSRAQLAARLQSA